MINTDMQLSLKALGEVKAVDFLVLELVVFQISSKICSVWEETQEEDLPLLAQI